MRIKKFLTLELFLMIFLKKVFKVLDSLGLIFFIYVGCLFELIDGYKCKKILCLVKKFSVFWGCYSKFSVIRSYNSSVLQYLYHGFGLVFHKNDKLFSNP